MYHYYQVKENGRAFYDNERVFVGAFKTIQEASAALGDLFHDCDWIAR